jgi:molybdenum cofactor biosynthesis enzyme MoaA
MNLEHLAGYDRGRDFSAKPFRAVCYAPFTNLFFDQWGMVRVCCWNGRYPVGDARTETIDEIWHGEKLRRLRQAMVDYSFEFGCQGCEQQINNGWIASTNMRWFERFAVEDITPRWPRRIELSISNSCNLECVMCSGIFSSAIRKHRERLPPLPKIYPSDFVDSLRKYIPHLEVLKFLGGEPFLVPEYYRLWDMMIEDGVTTQCHLTTNGTQFNSRIEKIMAAIPMGFAVSLDGATKQTVESIRVGADFDQQMRILRILRAYTRAKRTDLSLTYCFMRQNWHEFGDYCLMADEWGCNVGVNQVNHPPEFAMYNLPLGALRPVLVEMERQALELNTRLKRNRTVWFNELERVRRTHERLMRQAATAAK